MFVARETFRRSARMAYSVLFVLSAVLAWLLRDFAKPVLDHLPWIIRGDVDHSDRWYGQQAAYRVSMGTFMFYGLMSVSLLGVRYKSDKRDQYLHHGGWLLKIALWLGCLVLPFFLPNGVILGYSWLARIGAGMFLVIQMLILLDCTQSWNDAWVAQEDERFLYGLLAASLACYLGSIGTLAFLFYWFNPSGVDGGCGLNVSIIVLSGLLVMAFSAVSLHPKVQNGSLFPSAVIGMYVMYLAYGALLSEPHDYACNGLGAKWNVASGTTLVGGLLLTLVTTTYSAFRAGSNTRTFTMYSSDADEPLLERPPTSQAGADSGAEDAELGDMSSSGAERMSKERDGAGDGGDRQERALDEFAPVTYSYSFFHLVFALASMYIGMLMTGWGTGAEEKDLMDVGWASVWVKVGAQWFTSALYLWSMVAPLLFPDREFA